MRPRCYEVRWQSAPGSPLCHPVQVLGSSVLLAALAEDPLKPTAFLAAGALKATRHDAISLASSAGTRLAAFHRGGEG